MQVKFCDSQEFKSGQLYLVEIYNADTYQVLGICTAHSVDDIIERYSCIVPEGVKTLLLYEAKICKIPKDLKGTKAALLKKREKLEAIGRDNDYKLKLINDKLGELESAIECLF